MNYHASDVITKETIILTFDGFCFSFLCDFSLNYDHIPHKYCCLVLFSCIYLHIFIVSLDFLQRSWILFSYLFIPSTFGNESIYPRRTNLHDITSWILIKVLLSKNNWQKICHCSELVWTSFQYKWAVLEIALQSRVTIFDFYSCATICLLLFVRIIA